MHMSVFGKTLLLATLIATMVLLGACAGNARTGDTLVADSHAANLDCRTIRSTGSHLGKRVCKSVGQWEKESEEQREAIEQLQRDASISTGGGE